jgi:hypothetical protein
MLALIAGVKVFEDGRSLWYVLFALATDLAIGTYWFLGFTPFVFLVSVQFARSGARLERVDLRAIVDRKLLLSFLVAAACLVAVAPSVFFHWKEFFLYWRQAGVSQDEKKLLYPIFHILPYGLGSGLSMLSILGVVWSFGKRRAIDMSLVVWMAAYYLLVTLSGNSMWIRRFLPLSCVMAIFGAKLLVEAWDGLKGRPLPRIVVAVLGGSVFLATAFVTMAELGLMALDTRDSASQWVDAHMPAGKSIGIKNWFHIPQLDMKKYVVTTTVMADDFRSGRFDYYVVSDLDADIGRLANGAGDYSLIRSFVRRPSFLGVGFDDARAPEDMRYADPQIYIFEYHR